VGIRRALRGERVVRVHWLTHLPDGVRIFEKAGGEKIEIQPRLLRHERPLNVAWTSGEEIGRWMSNFAPTPFVLDGRLFS
jgi:hypothetical protein